MTVFLKAGFCVKNYRNRKVSSGTCLLGSTDNSFDFQLLAFHFHVQALVLYCSTFSLLKHSRMFYQNSTIMYSGEVW